MRKPASVMLNDTQLLISLSVDEQAIILWEIKDAVTKEDDDNFDQIL